MSILIDHIRERLRHNKNFMMNISGETGSGKSYSALRIAELIDPGFNAERIVFTPEDYINAIEAARKRECIIFDEAGVGIPNREWYSITNRLVNYTSQIFRFKNLVVIYTSPFSKFIDSSLVKLLHAYAETVGIDYKNNLCHLKVFRLQYNERAGKLYYHYLTLREPGGMLKRIVRVRVSRPSPELVREYEAKKKRYFKTLLKDAQEIIEEAKRREEEKKRLGRIDYEEICDKVVADLDKYTRSWGKRKIIDTKRIEADFNISYGAARKVVGKLLSRGVIS
jgi:hypothetical protein